jgi:PAS domain S-box-containing protein
MGSKDPIDPNDHRELNHNSMRTLRALQALTDTALSHLSLEALLPELLERVRTVTQVDNVAILLLDEATQELEVTAALGPEEELIGQVRIPVGIGFAGQIAATQAPLRVDDFRSYPVYNPMFQERLRSGLGVPLLSDARVLGVLHISAAAPRAFSDGDEAALKQAADRVARAVEHAQLFRSLHDTSLTLKRQASLINLSFEPIFAWSAEGGIVEWNPGAEHLYGYTRADALGRISHELLRTVHPIPLSTQLTVLDHVGQWTGELRHTTKDGREVYVESRQQIVELDGQRLVLETNRDVTERRQLERRTREALDALMAMAETLVADNGIVAVGEHANVAESATAHVRSIARRLAELTRRLLGCSRASIVALEGDQMTSRPIAIAGLTETQEGQWWEEQRARAEVPLRQSVLLPELERLLAGKTATFNLTRPPYEYANPYGVTAILGAPMHARGRLIGLLALDFQSTSEGPHVFTDEESGLALAVARLGAMVLEWERLLSEREATRAEALALADTNRRMDEFLGIASHELKTPLTTVKANLHLAERRAQQILQMTTQVTASESGKRDERQITMRTSLDQLLHLLERASQSAERQERLVHDLLDASRISSGQLEYRMAPKDLTALVRETVEELRLHEPTRLLKLDTLDEQAPVLVDADRLGQALTNYLTNGLKYSAADQPVEVAIRRLGEGVRVEVRDRGPGLSRAQQLHLFERFQRVEGIEVVSGSSVGLGLGLYISKVIVERHGGQVGIDSEVGNGSTFWFTLPLVEAKHAEEAPS